MSTITTAPVPNPGDPASASGAAVAATPAAGAATEPRAEVATEPRAEVATAPRAEVDAAPLAEVAAATAPADVLSRRPKRADALRNYEKLIAAARDAFAESGPATSLEEIARRAQVGIGTLYRHFPTRQALIEAVYVEELEALCRSASDLADLPPWDALIAWLHRFVGYVATKRALAEELLAHLDHDAEFFTSCRAALFAAGEPLLARAQQAGAVRPDTDFGDVIQIVSGIAKSPSGEPDQIARILDIALDGLRYRPATG